MHSQMEDNVSGGLLVRNGKEYRTGDAVNGGRLVFVGRCLQEPAAVIEYSGDDEGGIELITNSGTRYLKKYDREKIREISSSPSGWYLGLSPEEIADSGRDLLGEKVLKEGGLSYKKIKGILPPVTRGAYCFLGSAACWSGITVDMSGNIFPQLSGGNPKPTSLFSPSELDGELGAVRPLLFYLNGCMPILVLLQKDEKNSMECIYFVEHGDTDRDPLVWIRAVKYANDSGAITDERYLHVSYSRSVKKRVIEKELFWDSFAGTAAYWLNFEKETAGLSIPEKELGTVVKGTLASLFCTFGGDHPHYGHHEYGREYHDNFPPTMITALEAATVWGLNLRARRMAEHMLAHAFDQSGRFVYRQGQSEALGASGAEYGQLLWLIHRFRAVWEPEGWLKPYLDTLKSIGENLIKNRGSSGGVRLIKMCAEADTTGRIHNYINNNLWAVRGLDALASLLDDCGGSGERFRREAEDLLNDVKAVLEKTRTASVYGPLVPVQPEYTATPLNLSGCKKTLYPVNEEEFKQYRTYLNTFSVREDIKSEQDYLENTYANYRYYPEMLSSRLLAPEEEEALVRLREDLGGEILGMTRFLDRLDDWPVFNYARFLLETDRKDKFLLLLYAHTAHHGIPDLMVYYEQVGIDGAVKAPDCVPSLLTTALMTGWMFCFEPVAENALYLMRGVPAEWYKAPSFAVKGILTGCGSVDIEVKSDETAISVALRLPGGRKKKAVYLDVAGADGITEKSVTEGAELIAEISGTRIRLRPEAADTIRLVIKR